MDIKQLDQSYIAPTYARFPLNLVSGSGSLVRDDEGREYIDLGTGIAVNTFGLCDEIWVQAVTAQLHTMQHASNLYYTGPCAQLAQMLCEKTGMSKVFFSNSGAEANECLIKAARKWAAQHKGPEYNTIITLKQLPWPHNHNPCSNWTGCIPSGFPAADRGICLCRSQ